MTQEENVTAMLAQLSIWLDPMFDPPSSKWPARIVFGMAMLGMVLGLLWIRRLYDPRTTGRDHARWRYREGRRLAWLRDAIRYGWLTADRELDWSGDARRTGRWWVVRIELAIAVVVAGLATVLTWASPVGFGGDRQGLVALQAGSIVLAYVGVAWMWRIMHAGPEDQPTAWRYRGRN